MCWRGERRGMVGNWMNSNINNFFPLERLLCQNVHILQLENVCVCVCVRVCVCVKGVVGGRGEGGKRGWLRPFLKTAGERDM